MSNDVDHLLGVVAEVPQQFADVLQRVTAFADPLLSGEVAGRVWRAGDLLWR